MTAAADRPYGVRLNGIGSVNSFQSRYEMQGKEKESTFGLNRVNFGARTLNQTTGVFDRVDEMAESREWLTPYNFVQNNPVNRIDPDGAFDTKADAQQYAKENEISTGFFSRNKIQKQDDGSYAINNKRESTSIFKDSDGKIHTGALAVDSKSSTEANLAIPLVGSGISSLSGIGLFGLGLIYTHFKIGIDRLDRGMPVYDIPLDSYRYMSSNPGLSPGFDVHYMKGGSKTQRDGDYLGTKPKEFQRWFHREWKKKNPSQERVRSKEEIDEALDDWSDLGKPNTK